MNSKKDIDVLSEEQIQSTTDQSTLELVYLTVSETNEIVKSLKEENTELKRDVKAIRDECKKLQIRLLNEIALLRKQTKCIPNPSTRTSSSCLPKTPFGNVAEFNEFDNSVKHSDEIASQFEEELSKILAIDPAKYIRTAWKILLTDEVANNFCWRGTHTKVAVKNLAVTAVLRDAYQKKYDAIGEKVFEATCTKWFQTAADRIKYYNKSK